MVDVLEEKVPASVEVQREELKRLRNELEGAEYDSRKSESWQDIRAKVDTQFGAEFERLLKEPEQQESEKPTLPGIILQDRETYFLDREGKPVPIVKKDGWKDLGWEDEQIVQIREQLQETLGLDAEESLNTLENLVAVGKTFWDIQNVLTSDEAKARIQEQTANELAAIRGNPYIQTRDPQAWFKFAYLTELGIEREDYLKHFILRRDFAKDNDQEFLRERPRNLEELAWNISQENPNEFGVNGNFPVLKLQVEAKGNKKIKVQENGREVEKEVPDVEGRYIVNHANFLRWMYWQINEWYEIDTDEVTNYFEKVKITKDQFTSIDLGNILLEHNRFFTDEQEQYHGELYKHIFLIPWMLLYIRTYDLQYQEAMGSGREELAKKLDQLFFLNKLTKKTFGKSMLYYLTTLPVDLDAKGTQSDTKMGAAWMKMFLAYYNFYDLDGLKDILGEDNAFFTRDGLMGAIETVARKKVGDTGMPAVGNILGSKFGDFEKAFKDKNGKVHNDIQNEASFLQFINFFGTGVKVPADTADVVKLALKNAVSDTLVSKEGNGTKITAEGKDKKGDNSIDGYVIDGQSLGVAELIAQSFVRFTGGAARADFPALAAYDGATVLYNTEAYRRKMATQSRGGSTGNPFTIPQFKRIVVPLFEGIPVESAEKSYTVYKEGEHGEKGKVVQKTRRKTPLEVMLEMNQAYSTEEKTRKQKASAIYAKEKELREETKEANKSSLQHEINAMRADYANFEKKERDSYKIHAEQISFDDNTLRDYVKNHFSNGAKLYEQLFSAQEIDFDKFTTYDGLFRGVNFNRAEFQKHVKENFLKPLRYLYSTYGDINMNMLVRAPVFLGRNGDTDKWRFEEMPLGEAIFGYQILNIPEFRQEVDHLKATHPEVWKDMKEKGFKTKGKYIKGPDGRYVIDYDKVQDNKVLAYKQWALMKIGADMWTHISRHSTDPAYNMDHFHNIIEAIESIAGEVQGSDAEMTKTRVTKGYFSEKQIKWLKKMSKTTMLQLFSRQLLSDLFLGGTQKKESLFGESANIIITGIFKGHK